MDAFVVIAILLIYVLLLVAATSLYIEAAREKGYYRDKSTVYLYIVAAFFTPFTIGLYVAGLPDRGMIRETSAQNLAEDLPAI